jgi:hypothetical protein
MTIRSISLNTFRSSEGRELPEGIRKYDIQRGIYANYCPFTHEPNGGTLHSSGRGLVDTTKNGLCIVKFVIASDYNLGKSTIHVAVRSDIYPTIVNALETSVRSYSSRTQETKNRLLNYLSFGYFGNKTYDQAGGNKHPKHCAGCMKRTTNLSGGALIKSPQGLRNQILGNLRICRHCLEWMTALSQELKDQKTGIEYDNCSSCGDTYPVLLEEYFEREDKKILGNFLCHDCATKQEGLIGGDRYLIQECSSNRCSNMITRDTLFNGTYLDPNPVCLDCQNIQQQSINTFKHSDCDFRLEINLDKEKKLYMSVLYVIQDNKESVVRNNSAKDMGVLSLGEFFFAQSWYENKTKNQTTLSL